MLGPEARRSPGSSAAASRAGRWPGRPWPRPRPAAARRARSPRSPEPARRRPPDPRRPVDRGPRTGALPSASRAGREGRSGFPGRRGPGGFGPWSGRGSPLLRPEPPRVSASSRRPSSGSTAGERCFTSASSTVFTSLDDRSGEVRRASRVRDVGRRLRAGVLGRFARAAVARRAPSPPGKGRGSGPWPGRGAPGASERSSREESDSSAPSRSVSSSLGVEKQTRARDRRLPRGPAGEGARGRATAACRRAPEPAERTAARARAALGSVIPGRDLDGATRNLVVRVRGEGEHDGEGAGLTQPLEQVEGRQATGRLRRAQELLDMREGARLRAR